MIAAAVTLGSFGISSAKCFTISRSVMIPTGMPSSTMTMHEWRSSFMVATISRSGVAGDAQTTGVVIKALITMSCMGFLLAPPTPLIGIKL